MNTAEAEMLLHCHREGREPDSRMQKALRVAEDDADLSRRLREQLEFDSQITEAIHYIVPPEDLRAKLGALSESGNGQKGWRGQMSSPAMLSVLAGVLLFVGVIVFLIMESMAHFSGREAVERMLESTSRMNGTEFEEVKLKVSDLPDWFLARGYEGFEPPARLASMPVIASRVFRQDNRPIAQFIVEQEQASVILEFRASDFNVQLPPEEDWQIIEQKDWTGAIRQQNDRCCVIVVKGGKSEMQRFLRSLPK